MKIKQFDYEASLRCTIRKMKKLLLLASKRLTAQDYLNNVAFKVWIYTMFLDETLTFCIRPFKINYSFIITRPNIDFFVITPHFNWLFVIKQQNSELLFFAFL